VVYNSQAAFLAATSSTGVDTYTGLSITGPTASPITRNAGTYSYRASVAGGFFGAGTTANPWLSTNTSTDLVLFDQFAPNVQAIGANFFGSDIAGGFKLGNIWLEATDASGSISQTLVNASESTFFGFVTDSALLSLKVRAVQPGATDYLWPTIDNLTLGKAGQASQAVPEPASLALVALGLFAAVSVRRRA